MKKVIFVSTVLFILPCIASAEIRPSFDCSKAKSVAEKLICADSELATLDRQANEIHKKAKETTYFDADESRKAWKWREENCKDKECLLQWFSKRSDYYKSKILHGEWSKLSPLVLLWGNDCEKEDRIPASLWGNQNKVTETYSGNEKNDHFVITGMYEDGSVSKFNFFRTMEACEREKNKIIINNQKDRLDAFQKISKEIGFVVFPVKEMFLKEAQRAGEKVDCKPNPRGEYCQIKNVKNCPINDFNNYETCDYISIGINTNGDISGYGLSFSYDAGNNDSVILLKNRLKALFGEPEEDKRVNQEKRTVIMNNIWDTDGGLTITMVDHHEVHIDNSISSNLALTIRDNEILNFVEKNKGKEKISENDTALYSGWPIAFRQSDRTITILHDEPCDLDLERDGSLRLAKASFFTLTDYYDFASAIRSCKFSAFSFSNCVVQHTKGFTPSPVRGCWVMAKTELNTVAVCGEDTLRKFSCNAYPRSSFVGENGKSPNWPQWP